MLQVRALSPEPISKQLELADPQIRVLFLPRSRRQISQEPQYFPRFAFLAPLTDDVSQRRNRESILRGILESLFGKKDAQRGFSAEQRRIMWNTESNRRYSGKLCGGKTLTWEDFTLDHINPHSKGGHSRLENAALMCRKCNSAKGNRRR